MNASQDYSTRRQDAIGTRFKPLKIVVPVMLALLSISLMSQWYATNVSIPRFCTSPETTLNRLQVLLDDQTTIDNDQRRQYMIAAKLLFLHPMDSSESKSDYIERLYRLMMAECR